MSSTSDKKSNFFFANCMQCRGIIRIPIAIRPDASVSCPHCSGKFDLYDFLDQIPEVDVLDGDHEFEGDAADEFLVDESSSIEQQDGKFVVPPQLAAGIRKRRRRRRRSSSSSASNGTGSRTEAEELRSSRRQERAKQERDRIKEQREIAALRSAGRRKPSKPRDSGDQRSPVMETLKIAIGGLVAAPIAYLLLMWVFSRDPLGLVPTLNAYVPVLVPDALVVEDSDDRMPPIGSAGAQVGESDFSLPTDESGTEDFDDEDLGLDLDI